ncbi:hypothetical protein M408DRAFT_27104 [Serendipita vermifera MAFF 305830]|uniref:F-box domain-containing protein n=1 Tax=Serendipita vermifera MAFF 305830 TaxID=933852 RepID=A0A0C2X537_SERVB|nr:hypothetical protein M408DRAFT_27104 [Serendipita vermifera MAFF 305830]
MVFSRFRSVAPEIVVKVQEAEARFAAEDLSLIVQWSNAMQGDRIKLLGFDLPSSSMSGLIGVNTRCPKRIESLQISAANVPEASNIFHLTPFIGHFPHVSELRLYNLSEIAIEERQLTSTVKALVILGGKVTTPFTNLSWFGNLVVLEITRATFPHDMLDTIIILDKLQDLRVYKSDGIPWKCLYTPQLTRMDFLLKKAFPEEALSFLRRNQEIRRFFLISYGNNLQTVASVLPGLEALQVLGTAYHGLYDPSIIEQTTLPFLGLRQLIITSLKPQSTYDLESLVAARCRLSSASDPSLVPLRKITIQYPYGQKFKIDPEAQSRLGRCTIRYSRVAEPRYENWCNCTLNWAQDAEGAQ